MNEMIEKRKQKYTIVDILEDYCWIVGLSLIVAGILLVIKDPVAILGAGLVIACIGVILKARAGR